MDRGDINNHTVPADLPPLTSLATFTPLPHQPYWVVSLSYLRCLYHGSPLPDDSDCNSKLIERVEEGRVVLRGGLRRGQHYELLDEKNFSMMESLLKGTVIKRMKHSPNYGRALIYEHSVQYCLVNEDTLDNLTAEVQYHQAFYQLDQDLQISPPSLPHPEGQQVRWWLCVGQLVPNYLQLIRKVKREEAILLNLFEGGLQLCKVRRRFKKFYLIGQVYSSDYVLREMERACPNHHQRLAKLYCLCLNQRIYACDRPCFALNKKHSQRCIYSPGIPQGPVPPYSQPNFTRPKGLHNQENMCFFNAVVQCLLYTRPLTQYFIEEQERRQLNDWSQQGTWGEVALAYGNFVRLHLSPTAYSKDHVGLYNTASRWYHPYYHQLQQDAHEFLTKILDWLRQDLNFNQTKTEYAQINNDKDPPNILYHKTLSYLQLRHHSPIEEVMEGIIQSTVHCQSCHKKSITFQSFLTLHLPVASSRKETIHPKELFVFYVMQEPQLKITKIKISLKHGDTEEALRSRIRTVITLRNKYALGLFLVSVGQGVVPLRGNYFDMIHSVPNGHQVFCVEKYILGQQNEFFELFLRFTSQDVDQKIPFMRPIYLHKVMEVSNIYLYVLRAVYKAYELETNYKSYFHSNYLKEEFPFDLIITRNGTPIPLPRIEQSYMNKVVLEKGSDLMVQIRSNPKFNFLKLNSCVRNQSCNQALQGIPTVRTFPARIEDCMRLYCQQESLGSQWRCPHCPPPHLATKTITLRTLPQILILSLNRFKEQPNYRSSYNSSVSRQYSKNEQSVRYGQELVLGQEVSMEGTVRYGLYGVVVHVRLGGVTGVSEMSGHYYAYVKTEEGWFKCDDERVREVERETVLDCPNAYILFYRIKTHSTT